MKDCGQESQGGPRLTANMPHVARSSGTVGLSGSSPCEPSADAAFFRQGTASAAFTTVARTPYTTIGRR